MKDGKKFILVADDDREIRELLGLLLSGEGYYVECVEDGDAAVDAAARVYDGYLKSKNL